MVKRRSLRLVDWNSFYEKVIEDKILYYIDYYQFFVAFRVDELKINMEI